MRIAVLTAMGSERARIETLLEDRRETTAGLARVAATVTGTDVKEALAPLVPRKCILGRLGGNEIVLAETGIGKVNATVGACEIIREFHPDCVVSTGVAGGIDTSLQVMDVVVATEVAYHDVECGFGYGRGQMQGLPPRFATAPALLESAKAAAAALPEGNRVSFGLICSGDQFISDLAQLRDIKTAFPDALAVEMESAALAHTCHLFGVPFLGLRVISDIPGVEGHVDQYKDFWGEMTKHSFAVTRALLEAL